MQSLKLRSLYRACGHLGRDRRAVQLTFDQTRLAAAGMTSQPQACRRALWSPLTLAAACADAPSTQQVPRKYQEHRPVAGAAHAYRTPRPNRGTPPARTCPQPAGRWPFEISVFRALEFVSDFGCRISCLGYELLGPSRSGTIAFRSACQKRRPTFEDGLCDRTDPAQAQWPGLDQDLAGLVVGTGFRPQP